MGDFSEMGTWFYLVMFGYILAFLFAITLPKMLSRFWMTGSHGAESLSDPTFISYPVAFMGFAASWIIAMQTGVASSVILEISSKSMEIGFGGMSGLKPEESFNAIKEMGNFCYSGVSSVVREVLAMSGALNGSDVDSILVMIGTSLIGLIILVALITRLGQHFLFAFLTGILAITVTVPAALGVGSGIGLGILVSVYLGMLVWGFASEEGSGSF